MGTFVLVKFIPVSMLPNETPEICRLCLVKEHVDINIFEDSTQQLFYKITSCLPISVSVSIKIDYCYFQITNALLNILDCRWR